MFKIFHLHFVENYHTMRYLDGFIDKSRDYKSSQHKAHSGNCSFAPPSLPKVMLTCSTAHILALLRQLCECLGAGMNWSKQNCLANQWGFDSSSPCVHLNIPQEAAIRHAC